MPQVIAAGYASPTSLSVFLVNALRSVGIPARVVGMHASLPAAVQPLHSEDVSAGTCVHALLWPSC